VTSDLSTIQLILVSLPPLFLAISFHEAAHGYMAWKKGDYTAKMLGRVTLNPIKHIDPVGTVLFPLLLAFSGTGIMFGWAKPVPVNTFNFKSPRKDNMIVSAAGPLSNFLMAFAFALLYRILLWVPGYEVLWGSKVLQPFAMMIIFGIRISVILGVFNLFPIHPLDGSHILEGLLPPKQAQAYSRLAPYGFIILLAMMFTGILWKILDPLYGLILGLISVIFAI
jgi:Zn-dependent protease